MLLPIRAWCSNVSGVKGEQASQSMCLLIKCLVGCAPFCRSKFALLSHFWVSHSCDHLRAFLTIWGFLSRISTPEGAIGTFPPPPNPPPLSRGEGTPCRLLMVTSERRRSAVAQWASRLWSKVDGQCRGRAQTSTAVTRYFHTWTKIWETLGEISNTLLVSYPRGCMFITETCPRHVAIYGPVNIHQWSHMA